MAYTQTDREIRVETTLGEDVLLLWGLQGIEGVSRPFQFQLDLLSLDASLDTASLLRQPVKIFIRMADDSDRPIHGLISRVVQLGTHEGLTSYQAEVVPRLWFLSLTTDCRIFQNKSVPDIVEEIFQDQQLKDYKLKLVGSYPKRDYCVQYRESDLQFVSRLLEDEGIFYFFEHSPEKHLLVLADSPAAVQSCPVQAKAACATQAGSWQEAGVVLSLENERRVYSGQAALNDYDFEKPNVDIKVSVAGDVPSEIYDYPGNYRTRDEGERYAKIRLQEQEVAFQTVRGAGTCRTFQSGYRFDLENHPRDDLNQTYMLLTVQHKASLRGYRSDEREGFDYENTFTAIPNSAPFRPPRHTPKPVVHGSQTAVVTGKSNEEIWVDKYGRVKVKFFWDRKGKKDESSSCWVRVSQHWAGKMWGAIQIPRIGQEVIVDFLEGDPDQPIVTGRVYNAEQMPPYELPANQTQSGIKSRSSKGGSGSNYNEFCFEDKKGSELILLHAEKDLLTAVENDETRTVGRDRTTTIQNDETKTVKKGNETITLEMGNQSLTVKQGNQSVQISMGNQSTKLDLGKSEHEAMQSIELKVGQSSVKLDQTGVTIKGMQIQIEGQIQVQVKGLMTQVNGDAMLQLKGGITMIN